MKRATETTSDNEHSQVDLAALRKFSVERFATEFDATLGQVDRGAFNDFSFESLEAVRWSAIDSIFSNEQVVGEMKLRKLINNDRVSKALQDIVYVLTDHYSQ